MKPFVYFSTLLLLIVSSIALAKNPLADIIVTDAWVRATHPGQQTGVAYMKINSEKAAKLIKVETSASKTAEIHSMEMKDGIMLMRELESLPLPEKQEVKLERGGNHIMLMDLKQPLKAGEKIPLKLSVQRGSETIVLEIEAEVRKK
jgi:periplasmic copper chaperone A